MIQYEVREMNKHLFLKLTEAIKEELLDEEAVGIGMLKSVKGSVRRSLSTKPIMDATDDNTRSDLIAKGKKRYEKMKSQFDSKEIKHSSFKRMDDEMKKKALEYLGKRLEAFKIALEADEPSKIEAAKPALDKFEKSDDTPTDVKDIPVEDMYDPSEEEKKELISAYEGFRDGFYQATKRTEQGALIQALMNTLTKVQQAQKQDKESAAAFQRMDEQEEKQRVKKQLQNVKTDVASFYQEILKTRKLLAQAGSEARAGKMNFRVVKEQFTNQLEEIQEDIVEIYNDLINLSPPKATVQQVTEQEEEEKEGPGVQRAKNVQAAYDFVTKTLGKLMNRMISKDPVSEKVLIPAVDQALEKLDKIADIFPSVRAFSGQKGTFEELEIQYTQMIKDMGYLNDSFQALLKDEDTSSYTIKRLHRGLKRFSKEIEQVFGIESKIEGKPDPTDSDAKPIDPESNDTIEPSDDAQPTPDKPEIELKSPTDIRTFFNTNIMKYPEFKTRFPQEDIDEDHFNALMLLYALSEYEQPSLQEREQEQDSLQPAVKKTEMFLNFDRDKAEDDLIRIRTLNKQVFNTILDFYQKVKRTDANNFDKIIRKRLSKNPLSVTARRDNLIKNFNFVEPPKDVKSKQQTARKKGSFAARAQKRQATAQRRRRNISVREDFHEQLTKILKPLIEKTLREL